MLFEALRLKVRFSGEDLGREDGTKHDILAHQTNILLSKDKKGLSPISLTLQP